VVVNKMTLFPKRRKAPMMTAMVPGQERQNPHKLCRSHSCAESENSSSMDTSRYLLSASTAA
jgi:hypothetical protein